MADPTSDNPIQFESIDAMRAWIAEHHPEIFDNPTSKFAPKLTYVERCEVLALCMEGTLDRRVVAAAYGINRATLGYITNAASRHYRNVRREYNELGRERFIKQYVSPNVIERYLSARKKIETTLSDSELKKARKDGALSGIPNKAAKANVGPFYFTSTLDPIHRKGEVVWADNPGPDTADFSSASPPKDRAAGWYVQVESWADSNLHGTEADSMTSTKAKAGFLASLMATEVEG